MRLAAWGFEPDDVSLTSQPLWGKELKTESNLVARDWMDRASVMKTQWKVWRAELRRASRWVIHIGVPGKWHVLRTRKAHVWDPPRCHSMSHFIWLFLIWLLYNTLYLLADCLLMSCELCKRMIQTKINPWVFSQSVKGRVVQGHWAWDWGLRGVGNHAFNPCSVCQLLVVVLRIALQWYLCQIGFKWWRLRKAPVMSTGCYSEVRYWIKCYSESLYCTPETNITLHVS